MYLYARTSVESHEKQEKFESDEPAGSVFGSILSSSLPAQEKTKVRMA
jgi:hypothetical protein